MELLLNASGYVCSFCKKTFASLTSGGSTGRLGGDRNFDSESDQLGLPNRSVYRSAIGHISKSAKCKAAGARLLVIDIPFRATDARVGGNGTDRPPRGNYFKYYKCLLPALVHVSPQ